MGGGIKGEDEHAKKTRSRRNPRYSSSDEKVRAGVGGGGVLLLGVSRASDPTEFKGVRCPGLRRRTVYPA